MMRRKFYKRQLQMKVFFAHMCSDGRGGLQDHPDLQEKASDELIYLIIHYLQLIYISL